MPLACRLSAFGAFFLRCTAALALLALLGCDSNTPSASKTESPSSSDVAASSSGAADAAASDRDVASAKPLKVVVVDDPPLAEALQRQWSTIAEEPLELTTLTAADVVAADRLAPTDVIIYPSALLGVLAEKQSLQPLSDSFWNGDRLARRQLLEIPRKRLAVWGEKPHAVPLGEPTPVLIYRADLFESLGLAAPTHWSDLQTLAARLSTREEAGKFAPPAADPWYGLLEPLAPGSAAPTLLLRAAPYARHRNQYSTLFDMITMEPLIASPPFVKALDELVAAHGMNPGPVLEMDAAAVRRELLLGHAAAGITWPVAADAPGAVALPESADAATTDAPRWGIAAVPGSTESYVAGQKRWEARPEEDPASVPVLGLHGRLGSIARSSRRTAAAANLLAMLSTADWSTRVLHASAGTGPSRTTHLDQPDRWVDAPLAGESARQYAAVIQETQRAPLWLIVPRIPGQARYLAALDEAVRAAVKGDQAPEEALQAAAAEWQKITDELGRDRQKAAYRQCLGVDP